MAAEQLNMKLAVRRWTLIRNLEHSKLTIGTRHRQNKTSADRGAIPRLTSGIASLRRDLVSREFQKKDL